VLASRIEADDLLVHEHDGAFLVEIKSQEPLGDDEIAELRRQGLVTAVRRLAPVLPVRSRKTTRVPFTTCDEMLRSDAGRGTPLWNLAVLYESARSGLEERQILDRMIEVVRILRKSVDQGIAGTSYDDRVLGHQSGRFAENLRSGRLLGGGALNRIVLYVTALMEVKSAMGVIVAAPTAGACAALPGAVIAMAEEMGLGEEEMAKALLASGLIGVFIATRFTFAAEVGGCQVEGGSGGSMAAAAPSPRRTHDPRGGNAGAVGGRRLHGAPEHDRVDLRSGRQPRRGAVPGQERDGRRQRPVRCQHGAFRLRSGDPPRRGDRHRQTGRRTDAARAALHQSGRTFDHPHRHRPGSNSGPEAGSRLRPNHLRLRMTAAARVGAVATKSRVILWV
jgi:hypothetical protein